MKRPVKEKIMRGVKIAIALILAVVLLASVFATVVRGAEDLREPPLFGSSAEKN